MNVNMNIHRSPSIANQSKLGSWAPACELHCGTVYGRGEHWDCLNSKCRWRCQGVAHSRTPKNIVEALELLPVRPVRPTKALQPRITVATAGDAEGSRCRLHILAMESLMGYGSGSDDSQHLIPGAANAQIPADLQCNHVSCVPMKLHQGCKCTHPAPGSPFP